MQSYSSTALITGAAGHLGRAVAVAMTERGVRCGLMDIDAGRLRAVFGEDSDKQMVAAADLRDAAAVTDAAVAIAAAFGPIDILLNIAGGFAMGPKLHETSPELWSQMMETNVLTMINTARAVVPSMIARHRGSIVNVAARAGLAGQAGMGAYSAAKAAVIRLTETMSAELREDGINVNCVLPSIIDTEANRADMPGSDPARWVTPAALACIIAFLASDEARAIHGASLPVVGLS